MADSERTHKAHRAAQAGPNSKKAKLAKSSEKQKGNNAKVSTIDWNLEYNYLFIMRITRYIEKKGRQRETERAPSHLISQIQNSFSFYFFSFSCMLIFSSLPHHLLILLGFHLFKSKNSRQTDP